MPIPKQIVAVEPPATLALDLDAPEPIPVLTMLDEPPGRVRARPEGLAQLAGREVERTVGRVGRGALPLTELESYECAAPVAAARG